MSGSGFAMRYPRPARRRLPAAFYYQQRRQRRDRKHGYEGWPLRVQQIADADNLYECYRQLLREGGPAAGLDGVHASDLSPSEAGDFVRMLSEYVQSGDYRANPVRVAAIPKPGTSEYRHLGIGCLGDCIIGKAVHRAFQDFWEKRFLPCSYGFRRGLNTWRLLAELEACMTVQRRWVLVLADIRRAFDTVPIDVVIALHKEALADVKQKNFSATDKARTLALVAAVLRGADTEKTRGIDQGGPYSPAALNVLLHFTLDVPLSAHASTNPFWFRYADNLVYLAQSVPEGRQLLTKIYTLLRPFGMILKDDTEIADLAAGQTAHLLGFSLQREGDHICYQIGPSAYANLRQHLGNAHDDPDPATFAQRAIRGWIDAIGPTFARGTVAEVLSIASEYGFREIPLNSVEDQWRESFQRWKACQERAQHRKRKGGNPLTRAAPPPPTTGFDIIGSEAGVPAQTGTPALC